MSNDSLEILGLTVTILASLGVIGLFYLIRRVTTKRYRSHGNAVTATVLRVNGDLGLVILQAKPFSALRVANRELAAALETGDRVMVYYQDEYKRLIFQKEKQFDRVVPIKVIVPNGKQIKI